MENARKKGNEQGLQEKIKHGSLHFPMDVYWNDFTKYVAGTVPWHWHEELEFVVAVKGGASVWSGNVCHELAVGEGIFLNSNVLHQMIPWDVEETKMFSVVMHPGILGIEKGYLLGARYVTPYIQNDMVKYFVLSEQVSWQSQILEELHAVYKISEEKGYAYEYDLHNKMCGIWFLLLQNLWKNNREKPSVPSTDEARIYQALAYIHEHYIEAITLEEIAEHINVSKSECCRCFQRNLKTTPFEYLMLHRIGVAARLLEETNESVTAISMMTGFRSNSYFCKQFRKYMNDTPNEYRKKGKGKAE